MSENKNDISQMFKKERKRTTPVAPIETPASEGTAEPQANIAADEPKSNATPTEPTTASAGSSGGGGASSSSAGRRGSGKPVVPGILTPEMFKKVRKFAAKKGLTHSELLVMAFNEVPREDLKARFAVDDSDNEGMMPASKPRRRANGSGSAQIQYWLDERQREWFLAQPELLGAPSRSAMLMALYELFFERIESSN